MIIGKHQRETEDESGPLWAGLEPGACKIVSYCYINTTVGSVKCHETELLK